MSAASPRYAPQRPFPAYAFLPGVDPHPTRDPRGHSFRGAPEPPAAYYEPARWRENEDYLFGVDLYNHGYLWEAHEAWEGLWHAAKHDALQAELLQGLIQCAAGALKIRMRQPRGLAKLTELGTARLERVADEAGPRYMGAPVAELVDAFRAFAASAAPDVDARPRIVLE
ncbi:MAG: DUF309 domain-containing protein [Planctomycetes bacterium]|nr:DUF309 domain-containing protein [Planctomycetota bacterium]